MTCLEQGKKPGPKVIPSYLRAYLLIITCWSFAWEHLGLGNCACARIGARETEHPCCIQAAGLRSGQSDQGLTRVGTSTERQTQEASYEAERCGFWLSRLVWACRSQWRSILLRGTWDVGRGDQRGPARFAMPPQCELRAGGSRELAGHCCWCSRSSGSRPLALKVSKCTSLGVLPLSVSVPTPFICSWPSTLRPGAVLCW